MAAHKETGRKPNGMGERTPNVEKKAIKLAKRVKTKNYDCVWIINKENVEVIK